DRIHPVAGSVVFWSVVLAAAWAALYCVIAYAKLPAALIPPEEEFSPKHDAYLEALRVRLATNPRTRGKPLTTQEEIENAIGVLSVEADSVVRRTASTVFLSTALMQNGRLDALILLFTQIQMVTRVARDYVQRPSPRELIRKSATAAAVQHLGRIVRENGALVVRKIWESTGRALIDSGVSKAEDIAAATRGLMGKISAWRGKEDPSRTSI